MISLFIAVGVIYLKIILTPIKLIMINNYDYKELFILNYILIFNYCEFYFFYDVLIFLLNLLVYRQIVCRVIIINNIIKNN